MQITVELDSAYLQGDNLDDALAQKIITEITNNIWGKIRDKVDKQIDKIAKAHVQEQLDDQIKKYVRTFIKTEKVQAPRFSDFDEEDCSLEDYIKYMFDKDSKSDKIEKVVRNLASDYSSAVKDRYDMAFASQMITKMKEANLLKENVASALFESTPKE